ncbi:Gal4p family of zinc cluster protein [Beauveria brongniartii RCEF 3172]|uniref:Gal4p family of zinc cluster protein n=1 Tax=Beauveria brongniartii RCEF 3172 TaxID=1081107 RepID=A0A167BK36_9HYPO|nr:Gal4p family of zinc cluster protein [Beauveria brongniartii RCEF 3172]
MTLAECQTLCAVYFSAVHPLFAFLLPETFTRRLARGWSGGGGGAAVGAPAAAVGAAAAAAATTLDTGQPNFAAVVALVAVLGSVFSPTPHAREQDIKRHGLAILDRGLSTPVAPVDMDTVAGWILRALYMRLTTRPAISAMATHAAMHMAEMIGLHREMQDPGSSSSSSAASAAAAAAASTSTSTSKVSTSSFSDEELETRRRCFCVARFLNLLLTTEYGLSAVSPRHATCLAPAHVPGAHIDALYTMSNVLHDAEAAAAATRAGLDSDEFADLFLRLRDMPRDDDLVALFAADVCLCLLRRFSASSLSASKPSPRIVGASVAVLRRALDAIAALLAAGRTWWNMLSVPFQSVCICVLVDGMGLLELLPPAMELLRGMADRFESHMAREALATAQQVIAASRGRTDAKLAIKDAALSHALPAVDIDWASFDTGFDLGDVWPPVIDFFG